MFRNTVINTLTFYYPLGNTPAVSLTQDLPPEHDADILLLGCGDVRNLLFTCFMDPERRLDVTCCDIEPAILARNILLLTLISDGKVKDEHLWSVYYHIKLDRDESDVLQKQLRFLLAEAESRKRWDEGLYGAWLAFCDQRTFERVKRMWKRWSTTGLGDGEKSKQEEDMHQTLINAVQIRRDRFQGDDGISYSSLRSASPASQCAFFTLPKVTNHWWKAGIVDEDKQTIARCTQSNPTLLLASNAGVVLHYGQEPLNGFLLAPAYVPLDKQSELRTQQSTTSFGPVVTVARKAFGLWTKALRKTLAAGSFIRFCAADALATCHTLQKSKGKSSGTICANLPYDNWTCQPLTLDISKHKTRAAAPTRFNVIDTSNLIDHLGALNIIAAAAPLLKSAISSTLYTEVLVHDQENQAKQLGSMICGDLKTTSILLGLSPVELWTNATSNNEADEGVLHSSLKAAHQASGKGKNDSTQSLTRVRWKLLPNQDAPIIKVDAQDLTALLTLICENMFQHEDLWKHTSNPKIFTSPALNNPHYTKAGFAALANLMKMNIASDWSTAMQLFVENQQNRSSTRGISKNFFLELEQHLQLGGLLPAPVVVQPSASAVKTNSKLALANWQYVPGTVNVSVQMPRKAFSVFTEMPAGTVGVPLLSASLVRENIDCQELRYFVAVQVGFGRLQATGGPQDLEYSLAVVDEDEAGWSGSSPVILSFFAPSSLLSQYPDATIIIRLQSTPQTVAILGVKLGPEARIFAAALSDASVVHISQFQPGMKGLPQVDKTTSSPVGISVLKPGCRATVSLQLDKNVLSSITGRLDFESEETKALLADKANAISVQFPSPLIGKVTVGKRTFDILFPTPMAGSKHKARVARKSSYIELVAPLWDPLGEEASTFMFPTSPGTVDGKCSPTSWNTQRVNLDLTPKIDMPALKGSNHQWLITHTSLAFSDRERRIRDAALESSGLSSNTRVELKEGIFSLLMQFTGIQGQHAEIFGLAKSDTGVHVLILPAALRLDLVTRGVVLDAALIPLTLEILQDRKVVSFVETSMQRGVVQIKVSADELKGWKAIMPSLVERCRTWQHKTSCEYIQKNAIPLTLDDGKMPLCSCGHGKFPAHYMRTSTSELRNFDYVLKRYATRAAISPIFAVSYVENCFLSDFPKDIKGVSVTPLVGRASESCKNCGASALKDSDAGALLRCGGCRKVKYCSKECQKADRKAHKPQCA